MLARGFYTTAEIRIHRILRIWPRAALLGAALLGRLSHFMSN